MAYSRFKFKYNFPAGVEIVVEKSDEAVYLPAEEKAITAVANGPGIGVRRAQLVFQRASEVVGHTEDVAVMHFDFMNITGGEPDDTWIAGDFNLIEGAIEVWFNALRDRVDASTTFDQIRWYRIGPNVVPPNPPAKIHETNIAGSASGLVLPPQVAISITFKHPVRRCWGRTYLPHIGSIALGFAGRIDPTAITDIANATGTLLQTCHDADFIPVVYSKARAKAFAVETVQVDDVFDVIRRRRYDRPSVREVRPV